VRPIVTRYLLNRLFGMVVAGALALTPSSLAADHLGQAVIADGVVIYLGVMRSQTLVGDTASYGDHNMLCPPPGGHDNYHVMVALFDSDTGERITDADVYARVSSLGLVGPRKHFGAVEVAGAMCYCNYFDLSAFDRYNVKIDITRSESPKVIHAQFTYRP
jgi:hypothetical protein